MPQLKPFRQYNENDVINLFAFDGTVSTAGVNKGTLVKLASSGFRNTDDPTLAWTNGPGASFDGTVSMRYEVPWKVQLCQTGSAGVKDVPLGITLYDIKEWDENGEKLIFNPRKAAELQCVLSGMAVPVLTKGLVLYSGTLTNGGEGSIGPGATVYAGANGELGTATTANAVGKTLGGADADGYVLLKLEL